MTGFCMKCNSGLKSVKVKQQGHQRQHFLWLTLDKKFPKDEVFYGPYFPVFGVNTNIYSVNLRIQSKYGKIRTKKTLYFDTFHAV